MKLLPTHIRTTLSRGFSLPELLVTISIITLITLLVIVNYRKFDSNIIITDLAYDVGLSVRKAQSFGLGTRGIGNNFTYAYGIHFDSAEPTSYVLYVDAVSNKTYDATYDGTKTERIERFRLQKGYSILKVGTIGADGTFNLKDKIDITFVRPNPDATIYQNGSQASDPAAAVYLQSPQGTQKCVLVRITGQISVRNECEYDPDGPVPAPPAPDLSE